MRCVSQPRKYERTNTAAVHSHLGDQHECHVTLLDVNRKPFRSKSKQAENMKQLTILVTILVSFTQAATASIIFCGEQKHISKIHILTSLFSLQLPSIPMCWQPQCQEATSVTELLKPPTELHLPKRLLELDALVHIDRDPATQMYCYPQCRNQSRLEEVQFLE